MRDTAGHSAATVSSRGSPRASCDMSLDRIEPKNGRRNACEIEHVIGRDAVGFSEDGIAEGNIDAESLSVELSSQPALGAKPPTLVLHGIVLDRRMLRIVAKLKRHEVAEIQVAGFLKACEDRVCWADQP